MFASKHPAFLEKGFRLRTRLRRTRGAIRISATSPKGKVALSRSRRSAFPVKRSFFLPPDTDLYREQSQNKNRISLLKAFKTTFRGNPAFERIRNDRQSDFRKRFSETAKSTPPMMIKARNGFQTTSIPAPRKRMDWLKLTKWVVGAASMTF